MPTKKRRQIRAVASVSLPPETARLVERAAAVCHEKPSVFLRAAAVDRANRVLGIVPADTTPAATAA